MLRNSRVKEVSMAPFFNITEHDYGLIEKKNYKKGKETAANIAVPCLCLFNGEVFKKITRRDETNVSRNALELGQ